MLSWCACVHTKQFLGGWVRHLRVGCFGFGVLAVWLAWLLGLACYGCLLWLGKMAAACCALLELTWTCLESR